MDRYDFYYKQKVRESELDDAFDAVENALAAFLAGFNYIGVVNNADTTEANPTPNLTVDISGPALIYDQQAQRIAWSATQNVDMTLDENGSATAVVTSGNEKYLSIFAEFDRILSDPRTDGFGATVFFDQAESFKLNVVQGSEAPAGTAVKPSLRGDQILLADVLITYSMTQIQNSDIDLSRMEVPYDLSGAPVSIKSKSMQDAIQDILDEVNDVSNNSPLLSANNTFTGQNTFEDDIIVDENIVLSDNGTELTPRIFLDRALTSPPEDYTLVAQLSDNASGTQNIRLYVRAAGYMLTLGCYYNNTTNLWTYDAGVSAAYALKIMNDGMHFLQHTGASTWADSDTAWSDELLFLDDSGLVLDNSSNDMEYKFGQDRTLIKNIGLFQAMTEAPSSVWNWLLNSASGYWESNADAADLIFPISLPIGMGLKSITVEVLVLPGTTRSGGDRIQLVAAYRQIDWSTPAAGAAGSAIGSATTDDGTNNIQVLSVTGNVDATEARSIHCVLTSGNNSATFKDRVYGVRVTCIANKVPLHHTSM